MTRREHGLLILACVLLVAWAFLRGAGPLAVTVDVNLNLTGRAVQVDVLLPPRAQVFINGNETIAEK